MRGLWLLGLSAFVVADGAANPTMPAAAASQASALPDYSPPDATPPGAAAPVRRITYPAPHYPELVLPDGKRRSVKSLLNVPHMGFGEYVWDDKGVPPGPTWIRIDLGNQILSVFRGGQEIGTAVIIYGTDGKPTPSGVFPILAKAAKHRSTLYDAEMPFMLRLTQDGVAIHASRVHHGSATHGCIGIPIAFAEMLFAQVHRGTLVAVLPSKS